MKKTPKPRGERAAGLRQRKFALLRRYRLPEALVAELLPGSLSQSRRRCGKPTCHCATEAGHPSWYLAFMVGGKQRVEHIPDRSRRPERFPHAGATKGVFCLSHCSVDADRRRL